MSDTTRSTAPGIVFPTAGDGTRSTTRAGAAIVAAALEPLSARHAAAARHEDHWRRSYPQHFRRLVEGALRDADAAHASAQAGLDAAWTTLAWGTEAPAAGTAGAAEPSLHAAWPALLAQAQPFATHTLRGSSAPAAPWQVPYRGELLGGARLARRIDAWAAAGVIEPSAAAALHRCAAHPEWFDLSDRTLVLLGAGSEAGPLAWLARWRANLVAVDVARPAVWQKIEATVRAGNATLQVPLARKAGAAEDWAALAGADLLTQAPSLAAWLLGLAGSPALDIGAHAYLDGERHVRVSLGMDAIVRAACQHDRRSTLAFMATPTDIFAVPKATAESAMQQYRQRPLVTRTLQQPLRLATGDRFFQPNVTHLLAARGARGEHTEYGVVDSLVIEQGPNYALAKRLQQWRALLARAAGHRVSLNIAPSTTTASVVKNPALAAGFAGADTFGIEVFEPPTTNALMAALWVHDLRSDESAANPARPLAHPFELFMDNACHGGLWSGAYLPRSALPFAAALGWVRGKRG